MSEREGERERERQCVMRVTDGETNMKGEWGERE